MLKNSSFKKQIWEFCLQLWCKTKRYCEVNVEVYVCHQLLCDKDPTEIEDLNVSGIEEADSSCYVMQPLLKKMKKNELCLNLLTEMCL